MADKKIEIDLDSYEKFDLTLKSCGEVFYFGDCHLKAFCPTIDREFSPDVPRIRGVDIGLTIGANSFQIEAYNALKKKESE